MAQLLGLASHRTVQAWESGQNTPTPGLWALFLLAAGRHPGYTVQMVKA
jgi:DNA-binding transcriptional regulator YiaG